MIIYQRGMKYTCIMEQPLYTTRKDIRTQFTTFAVEEQPGRTRMNWEGVMASISITVNGVAQTLDVDPSMPLLWLLRDRLGATGTKFGCGIGECGACTVHVDGEAVRSCITPVSAVADKQVTTIEGLSLDGSHRLQKAWIAENVAQCGYCQPGQIMTAAALLKRKPKPNDEDIASTMAGVLCRCGSYGRIQKAIQRAISEGGG